MLSRAAFASAQGFLKTQARPLDKTLFEHHFESGPAENVTAELAQFQNPDGGFGQTLEPDLRQTLHNPLTLKVFDRL